MCVCEFACLHVTIFDCAAHWCGCGLAFEHSHLLPGFVFFFFFRGSGEGVRSIRSSVGRESWMNVESFVIVVFFYKKVQVGCRSRLQGLNSGF